MTLSLIISFIVFGLILIILEILFVPGTTLFGIAGLVILLIGIYRVFLVYGTQMGLYSLAGSVLVFAGIFYLAVKTKFWDKLANKGAITGKVNDELDLKLNPGDKGTTLSMLRPMGTVLFGAEKVEVQSELDTVAPNKEVVITRIVHNKIFVKAVE